MRAGWLIFLVGTFVTACSDNRVYEEYVDFDDRAWVVSSKPSFEFTIHDTTSQYTLLANVRNEVAYPYSRIFVGYTLHDSVGRELKKDLVSDFLFDAKTGKPLGKSGLGDIYDHQILLIDKFLFPATGKYRVEFEQFMRTDTLKGMLAIGLRVQTVPRKSDQ